MEYTQALLQYIFLLTDKEHVGIETADSIQSN